MCGTHVCVHSKSAVCVHTVHGTHNAVFVNNYAHMLYVVALFVELHHDHVHVHTCTVTAYGYFLTAT